MPSEICQLAQGISNLRYFAFSLTGLLAFLGIAGAYFYVGTIRALVNKTLAIVNSIFGLIGAGVIATLLLVNRLFC